MDTLKLDAALNDYPIDGEGFIKNVIMLLARNRKRLYKRIDEEPIKNIWTHFIAPYDTTGITLYSLNFIAIPLGAMEKPFYDPDYLRHIRLAGLGFSVAHEMAHHIDSLGIKFNTTIDDRTRSDYKDTIPHFHVWEREVSVEYMNMTGPNKHKIVQFQFEDTELKEKEYFADTIAIQLAYKTFKKKETKTDTVLPYLPLTSDQSFFVFLAQTFCTKLDYFSMVLDFFESPFFPPETRVKNMLKKNAAFHKAFNCKATYTTDYPFPYIALPDDDVAGV
ncbi:Neprilysin-3 [Gryllus bimaculatus]|nr:Neprilysin-3 [Gryllus bimaculatus]